MTITNQYDKEFLEKLEAEVTGGVMFYVISSERQGDGTLKWARSVGLNAADAKALAKHLLEVTGRIVEVVRVYEVFKPSK